MAAEGGMYASASTESGEVIVGVFGGAHDESDHARAVASIVAADAGAVECDQALVCILVTQRDTESPPAVWRKRMADANRNMRAREYRFALVSPNPLLRGVLTAINWLSSVPSHHHYNAVATFEEAASWVRAETGQTYPMLEMLYERARQELTHGR